ncbi:MAG: GAF domain-containing protein [Planctomycetota bacterium]|nr:GAF domain-containing protein [Planctomycetota bacterium]
MSKTNELIERLDLILRGEGDLSARLQAGVEELAEQFQARSCTFHRAIEDNTFLELVAQTGLPPHIAELSTRIPFGKGMAGICAQRREPVTMCNLQTDDSGVARPAARDTRVEGAVVVPLLIDDRVAATLGIGKGEEYDYSDDELQALEKCAAVLMSVLA